MTVIAFTDDDNEDALDARLLDCGHPNRPELHRERFYLDRPEPGNPDKSGFHKGRRAARCLEGHSVYLRRNPHRGFDRDTAFHWVHWRSEHNCSGDVPTSPSEGQEHKILKTRVTTAFSTAGCSPVREEVRSTTRKYVSDIQFWRPDHSMFAAEIQISDMSEGRARYRTNAAKDDGMEAVIWMTTRPHENWQDAVPCVRLHRPERGDQRGAIEAVAVFVTGTVVPTWQHCGMHHQCWRRKLHNAQDCPGHLEFHSMTDDADEAVMLGIDTFADRITTGDLVVVDAPREKQAGTHPVISTPEGQEQALDYAAELEEHRTEQRREREMAPARPYCTQPDRPVDEPETADDEEPADAPEYRSTRPEQGSDHQHAAATPASGEETDPRATLDSRRPSPAQQDSHPASSSSRWHRLKQQARHLAINHGTYVRVIPDVERFLAQRAARATTLLPDEVIMTLSAVDRGRLLSLGYPCERLFAVSQSPRGQATAAA